MKQQKKMKDWMVQMFPVIINASGLPITSIKPWALQNGKGQNVWMLLTKTLFPGTSLDCYKLKKQN